MSDDLANDSLDEKDGWSGPLMRSLRSFFRLGRRKIRRPAWDR